MKRGVFLIIIFISILQTVKGQDQRLRFGVFVDPQFSWLSPEARNIDKKGTHLGVNAGLIMDKFFQKHYAFSTGLSIGSQGGGLSYSEMSTMHVYNEIDTIPVGATVNYKLKYITVPIGLKFTTNQIGYITYYAQVGFTCQFNVQAKAVSDAVNLKNDNISEEINLFNVGYHFGGGLEYSLGGQTAITVGIIYSNGFTDVTTSSYKIASRVLSVRIGMLF
jgi:hypothetical protein